MYIIKSLVEGLGILGFDREVIKKVAREKNLEEIFLSTLSVNYFFVMIAFLVTIFTGGIALEGRNLNMTVFFGLLMVYPFVFNIMVYLVYGFFGLMAEMLDSKKTVKPLISVGFHTAIVYSVLFFIIAVLSVFSLGYAGMLLFLFLLYFLYSMFLSISTVYNYSFAHTVIVVLVPFLVIGLAVLLASIFFPGFFGELVRNLLA